MDKSAQRGRVTPDFVAAVRALLGKRVSSAPADLSLHGRGESFHAAMPPELVVYPDTTAEVAALVRLAAAHKVPVIPFGAGTSLEGHTAALFGGLCIDMSRMNRIIAVRPEDMDATVEAGVTRKQLNAFIRDTGLFFPVDPGADATLGGMAATRASGTNAVRYGTMRETVLALTVVLPNGEVIKTANRARKSAAGYDLTRLFVGAEGTLGLITEVTVRLTGVPEAMAAAICAFPDVGAAVTTAIETIQSGVPVARVEFVDAEGMAAANRFSNLTLVEKPTLFFEFHGSAASVKEQAELASAIAEGNGGTAFEWAETPEARSRLWDARHTYLYAVIALRPGGKALTTDVCVPISQLAPLVQKAKADAAGLGFPASAVGHVGDGNFHMTYVIDPDNAGELALAQKLASEIAYEAVRLGGTVTGEHGIGYGKAKYMVAEHGEGAVALMRTLKAAIDPDNLFNPGKVLPE